MPIDSSGSRWPERSPASRSSRSRRNARRCSATSSVSALIVMRPCTSSRREAADRVEQRRQAAGLDPALLRLVGAVHLDQDRLPVARGRPAVELGGQIDPIDRMDQGEPAHRVARLVPLQRADEVPATRHAGERLLLLDAPPGPGSRRRPSSPAATAARTASGPWVLVTATMRTGWVHPPMAWCVATVSRTWARRPGRAGKSIALEFTWGWAVLAGDRCGRVRTTGLGAARPEGGVGREARPPASSARRIAIRLATAGVGVDQLRRREPQGRPRRWRWCSRGPAAPRSSRSP